MKILKYILVRQDLNLGGRDDSVNQHKWLSHHSTTWYGVSKSKCCATSRTLARNLHFSKYSI
jgi:hypothetical protein